ncbi:MAG: hypothetical protein KKC79_00880 [Gammaproteobacteria bacterium]|nr:hypothetical protein [Gammaproteobacteria bacterium]MBU1443201.1 hypothetical protein [Gammaproteobacteria bacterium]MBU2287863.1 hypothetical protein [Gammaproteobacteria bacterium]MBU2407184.1 hypothetical protein [Gammaproteobacteria bacterium]
MTDTLQLPRFKSRHAGLECRFNYHGRSWTLRRNAEAIGDDALMQYALLLDGHELDPFVMLDRDDWERWRQLPYAVPHSVLCPRQVPSARLCGWVQRILDRYAAHSDQSQCFWPLAA